MPTLYGKCKIGTYYNQKIKEKEEVMSEKRKEENIDIRDIYLKQASLSVEDFQKEYQVNAAGLDENQVTERKKQYGDNQIKQKKPKQWYHYLISS